MKQFNLQEYLAKPKRNVVTRDGCPARVICTDRAGMSTKPVVALIKLPNGDEKIKSFWADGVETAGCDGKDDLFFTPNKHTDYINLYHNNNGYYLGGMVFSSEERAKKIADGDEEYITTIKVELEEE